MAEAALMELAAEKAQELAKSARKRARSSSKPDPD
jgi:hypothetical protein